MIISTAELDILGVLGVVLGVGAVVIPLLIFAIKALIYKTVSPLKEKLDNVEGRMTVVEANYVSLLDAIKKLPDTIDEKARGREDLFNLEIKHIKADLDKKADKK